MKENINALDEINKGANMGVDAINFIIEKTTDDEFKKTLQIEKDNYKVISNKINEIYPEYNSKKTPHEPNTIDKIMTWYGTEMKTFLDKSNSKIAELLIKGTSMGIIEGKRILNNKEVDKKIEKIIKEYIKMQENSIEKLKQYL